MMNKILDAIMKTLLSNGYAKEEDAEIVRYGLELTIMKTITSAFMLITALILKSFIAVIIFLVLYTPMRSCCGGYHSSSRKGCFLVSVIILAAVIAASKLLQGLARLYVSAALLFLGAMIIIFIAPTEAPTKPFDDIERRVFRRRSLIITSAETAIAVILALFRLYTPMLSVSLSVFITAVLLIAGRISNRKGVKK
ncbi:MAG: accessory gene regulator B family protein [Ruminococcus sp.]|uniref:accessory gene regulator B family protein n=1 Tax=Ruminococcus sp. TaxID=41978 RepID=UPI0025DB475B|nr:accessory gene regulator B family protein [Ruminococcus sp.]MCR4793605.1 accessory gene regulator B family protein [Ruminococcus sp.]